MEHYSAKKSTALKTKWSLLRALSTEVSQIFKPYRISRVMFYQSKIIRKYGHAVTNVNCVNISYPKSIAGKSTPTHTTGTGCRVTENRRFGRISIRWSLTAFSPEEGNSYSFQNPAF